MVSPCALSFIRSMHFRESSKSQNEQDDLEGKKIDGELHKKKQIRLIKMR